MRALSPEFYGKLFAWDFLMVGPCQGFLTYLARAIVRILNLLSHALLINDG